jgi:hypothetical protein
MKWKARFEGGRVLEQFDANEKERLFKEVLDKQELLESFELLENEKIYAVSLIYGTFYINGVKVNLITEEELGIPLRDAEYRIIYYRRMRQTLSESEIGKLRLFCYLLGWQTTVNGKNIKRILQIYPNGNIFLQCK